MAGLPKMVEVRMGFLVFITKQGKLMGFNSQTNRFDKCYMTVTPADRFVMAMSTCGGMLARSLDPESEIQVAMAHMPSCEAAMRALGGRMTYSDVREYLKNPQTRRSMDEVLATLHTVAPALIDEMEASIRSPIFGPDLLAARVTEAMGSEIEVRVFGGRPLSAYIPEVVTGIKREFDRLGARTIIEESVLDLARYDRVAMIAPFAEDPTDLVRPWGAINAATHHHLILQLTAGDG